MSAANWNAAAREPIIPRGAYLTVGNPIKLSDSPAHVRRSPLLGEHTDEILKDVLGLGDDEIAAAREAGAI